MTNDEINRRVAVLEGWVEGRLFWHHEGVDSEVVQSRPPDYCGDPSLSQALQEKHGIATWPVDDMWAATTGASNKWATYSWLLTPRYDPSLRRAIALARIAMEDE